MTIIPGEPEIKSKLRLKYKNVSEMNDVFVYFAWSFISNSGHFMAVLGANMIKYASEVELYMIPATLEKDLWLHWIVLISKKYAGENGVGALFSQMPDIGKLFCDKINI